MFPRSRPARFPPAPARSRRAAFAGAPRAARGADGSRPLRELPEVRPALLAVGLAALLRLLAPVEEQVGVVGQLLDSGKAVLGRVEACLEEPQRERRELEHLAAPGHSLLLELLERHDTVHEPHLDRLLRRVLPAQEPDLLGLLRAHQAGEERGAIAAV